MTCSKKKFVVTHPAIVAQKDFNFIVGSTPFSS